MKREIPCSPRCRRPLLRPRSSRCDWSRWRPPSFVVGATSSCLKWRQAHLLMLCALVQFLSDIVSHCSLWLQSNKGTAINTVMIKVFIISITPFFSVQLFFFNYTWNIYNNWNLDMHKRSHLFKQVTLSDDHCSRRFAESFYLRHEVLMPHSRLAERAALSGASSSTVLSTVKKLIFDW